MDLFGILREIFFAIGKIFTLRMTFNGFSFSIGQMVVGLIVIGCSLQLLAYFFKD